MWIGECLLKAGRAHSELHVLNHIAGCPLLARDMWRHTKDACCDLLRGDGADVRLQEPDFGQHRLDQVWLLEGCAVCLSLRCRHCNCG